MAHQFFLTSSGNRYEITDFVGNVTWSGSIDELGETLDFTLPKADNPYFPKFPLQPADQLTMVNNGKVIYQGFVIEIAYDEKERQVNTVDPLWYLNKSKTTIQFRDELASACLMKLFKPFGIPIGYIIPMKTKIKKVYSEKAYSEIVRDILTLARREIGDDYRFQMDNGKLLIDRQFAFLINADLELFQGSGRFDLLDFISNPQRRVSIADMRNSIAVIKDEQVYASAADPGSVAKYGLLQDTISFQGNTVADAQRQAKAELNLQNRVNEEASFDLLGHDYVRAGRVLKVNELHTGIMGQYMIKAASHTLNNGIHKMNVTLQRY